MKSRFSRFGLSLRTRRSTLRNSRRPMRLETLEPRLPLAVDFTGPYELQHWTKSGITAGTTDIAPATGPAASAAFSYNVALVGGGVSARTASFTAVAAATGQVSFDYAYTGFHAFFQAFARFNTLGNATTSVVNSTTSDTFTFTGTATINVTAGQPFGFQIGGENFDSTSQLNGTLTITNFRAPSDIDGDGVLDEADNCRTVANAGQQDADADNIGDACDFAPIIVNSSGDDDDGNPANATTTLREAIIRANQQPGRDQISFNLPANSTINITSELVINDAITITGPGASLLTIDASAGDPTPTQNNGDGIRVFNIDNEAIAPLTRPGDPIIATSNNSPGSEGVTNAIDNTATKYLNFDELNAGFTVTPVAGSSIVNGLSFTSANDALERAPTSFRLEGSNDGVSFSLIRAATIPAFTTFFETRTVTFSNSTAYRIYRLIFPTIANPATANSMQISEVELLGRRADIPATFNAEISGLTITGGDMASAGGGIMTAENLTLRDSVVHSNATGRDGGGIDSRGHLTIENSTIRDNISTNQFGLGGGVGVRGGNGSVNINASTLSGNTARDGGGFYTLRPATIRNSTFAANNATREGGGLKIEITSVDIINSTISGNTAGSGGGGIEITASTVNIQHSTITGNTDNATSYNNSGGGIWSAGGNAINLQNSIIAGNHSRFGRDVGRQGLGGAANSLGNNILGRGAGGVKTQWTTGAGANDHYYEVVRAPSGITWTAADLAAREAGGHLVSINSADENNFVFGLIDKPELWTTAFGCCNYGPWIGGQQATDAAEPAGGWGWVTGESFTFTIWAAGEPNNNNVAETNVEDRIHYFRFDTALRASTWNDTSSTSSLPVAYVIEYDSLTYHPSDLVGVNPLLGALANNGGLTQTHAPQSNSPAIDLAITRPYHLAVLDDAPLLYYRLNETSGAAVSDLGSLASTAAYQGSPALNQPGFSTELGSAVRLNGTTSYVSTNVGTVSPISRAVMEAWIRPAAAQAARAGIMGINDAIEFGFSTPTTLQLWTPFTGALDVPYESGANAGKWLHVVAAATGTELQIYLNGELAGSLAHGALPPTGYGMSSYLLHIGGGGIFDDPAVNGNYFNGDIDEFALYPAISPIDLRQHYRAAFDEASGTLPTTDQRGAPRSYGAGYDIGSFEVCSPGDTNANGQINRADAVRLALNFGRTGVSCGEGDFDNNGRVDLTDLGILQSLLAAPAPSPEANPAASAVIAKSKPSTLQIGIRAAATAEPTNRLAATRLVDTRPVATRLVATRRAATSITPRSRTPNSAERTAAIDASLAAFT